MLQRLGGPSFLVRLYLHGATRLLFWVCRSETKALGQHPCDPAVQRIAPSKHTVTG